MLGTSKHMHIADADDDELDAFEEHEIDVLTAFCGQPIVRGWLVAWGGSIRRNAPICEGCAGAAGWVWDEASQVWYPPELLSS